MIKLYAEMIRTFKYYAILVGLFLITQHFIFAQENNFLNKYGSQPNKKVESSILKEIESGLAIGDVSKISKYFGGKQYLSFSNGISGYYSANQAFYVLEDYFKVYRVISFKFDNKKIEESISYATGVYYYERKGKRDSANVYVTLNKVGKNWFITQISIN
ncbi:MAG TPA: DUF4783 domain-containing protein [Ignavibacteriaceae bacterium]|jgi:hypothetical protein